MPKLNFKCFLLVSALFFVACKSENFRTPPKSPNENLVEGSPLTPLNPADSSQPVGIAPMSGALDSNVSQNFSDFVFPLIGGFFGDAWCKCRDIGTSPHIGQDINADGQEISVAVSDGTVDEISFQSSCGYAVTFKDSLGASWIYRHLNKPTFDRGDKIKAGQKIGSHSSYPTSGCGTGPHLHLERRSAGLHSGTGEGQSSERTKSCQYGARTCYFDPTIIKNSKKISTPRSESANLALTQAERTIDTETSAAVELKQSLITSRRCQGNLSKARYLESSMEELNSENVSSKITLETAEDNQFLVTRFEVNLVSDFKKQNICNRAENSSDCIVEYLLVYLDENNETMLLAQESGLANKIPALSSKEMLCFSNQAKSLFVKGRTSKGQSFAKRLSLKSEP
jgi:murein DD-endopeptidase MepM/ murein hydrolase activator NlpD